MEESVTGIVTNPFHIIEATNYMGKDATITQNTNAKDNNLATVIGPDKIIMDTGYFPTNAFTGSHQLSVRYFSDTTETYGLTIEYWVKYSNGDEELRKTVNVNYNADISPIFGNGAGFAYFGENKQVRIIVKSHSSTPLNCYVGVDWIQIDVVSKWNTISKNIHAPDTIVGSPAMLHIDMVSVNIVGNGSSYKYSATKTLSYTPHYFRANPIQDASVGGDLFTTITNYGSNSFTVTCTDIEHTNWSGNLTIDVVVYAFITLDYI